MAAVCPICDAATTEEEDGLCTACTRLLQWVRGYFAHVPGLPEKITPAIRFIEDLAVDSLDWMNWQLEAEQKLGIKLPDREYEDIVTVGDFVRALRKAGACWPEEAEVRLIPRKHWWSSYRWELVNACGQRSPSGEADA